jgi:retron-type reverse transcriptase
MQNKLARWAEADDQRKFDRLLRLIANRSWLLEAAHITLASSGAKTAGIDGMDKAMMESHLEQLQKSVENLPAFAIKKRQSLPVAHHYLIVFNTQAVFINWKSRC